MFLQSFFQKATSACVTSLYASMLIFGSFCVNQNANANECSDSPFKNSTDKLASKLVNHFWDEVQQQNVTGYSHLITTDFQGLNIHGVFNKEDQVSGLQGLTVTKFKIENLVAARYKSSLVISYDFLAEGKGIVSGPSIDIWHKKEGHWKQISHSYVPFE